MSKNWIAVASAEHARRGRDATPCGFMQVGHGKLAPLKRVKPGDRVACYAPIERLGDAAKLQSLVSIGLVQPGEPYAFDRGAGFVPYRRDVRYAAAREVPIQPPLATRWALQSSTPHPLDVQTIRYINNSKQ